MRIEGGQLYIPKPMVVISLTLLMLGCGIMIGAGFFPVHEKEPCKVKIDRKGAR